MNTSVWDNICYPDDPVPWIFNEDCDLEEASDGEEAQKFRASNAFLDGEGHLVLRAERVVENGRNQIYSGIVQTYNSFHFQYGYVEARFKMPSGQGFWPAFWMLPYGEGRWPQDEIDIMENLGQNIYKVYMTYHWDTSHGTQLEGYEYSGSDFSSDYTGNLGSTFGHTLGVDWQPDTITWYIDGIPRGQYATTTNITDKDLFLILSFALGGLDSTNNWPGPYDPTYFSSNQTYDFVIDYVRVWQRFDPAASGSVFLPMIFDNTN